MKLEEVMELTLCFVEQHDLLVFFSNIWSWHTSGDAARLSRAFRLAAARGATGLAITGRGAKHS